jgi:hypothetical protein
MAVCSAKGYCSFRSSSAQPRQLGLGGGGAGGLLGSSSGLFGGAGFGFATRFRFVLY